MVPNRMLGAFLLLAAALCSPCPASAQAYPSRPIHLVVPYSPGGLPDVVARILSQRLAQTLGQPVVVDNKPGAKGSVAAATLAASPADGYTFLVTDSAMFTINPLLHKTLAYDPKQDFAYVSLVGHAPLYLVSNQAAPAKNIEEFISYAKNRENGISYGSPGTGSMHHLAAEALKSALNIPMTHIPYRGTANSVQALLSGEVELVFASYSAVSGFVKADKVRLIGVSTAKRSSLTPATPAIAERVPGFDFAVIVALLGRAGTPVDAVQRINLEVSKIVKQPDVVEQLRQIGMTPTGGTPSELDKALREESGRIAKAFKAANLQPE